METGSDEEENGIYEEEKMVVWPLPGDIYGDALLTAVQAWELAQRRIRPSKVGLIWMLGSFLLFVLNFVLQLGLSWMLFASFVESREDIYEVGTGEKTAKLKDAIASGIKLDSSDEAVKLCARNQAVPEAYVFVLILWFSRMVQEIFEVRQFMVVMLGVPHQHDVMESSENENSEDENAYVPIVTKSGDKNDPRYTITWLPESVRYITVLGMPLLRGAIAIWITWLGAKFLVLAHNTADLVIKSLCMQFFVTIDELLFKSLVSEARKTQVAKTSIRYFHSPSEMWDNIGSMVTRWILVAVTTILTWFVVFAHIRTLRYTCADYFEKYPADNGKNAGITWLIF